MVKNKKQNSDDISLMNLLGGKIIFDNIDEVLERDVIAFGNSGRVNIPKKHVGKKAKITIFKKEEGKKVKL